MTLKHRVLVVEDDESFCQLISTVLVRAGYGTAVVCDGLAALDALESYKPDVIFLDMHLPLLDGWGFLQKYRDLPGLHKPIIASSAGNVDRTSLGDVIEFFPKPFNIKSFLTVLESVLLKTMDGAF